MMFIVWLCCSLCFLFACKKEDGPPYKLTRYGIVVDSNHVPLRDVRIALFQNNFTLISMDSEQQGYGNAEKFWLSIPILWVGIPLLLKIIK